MFKLMDNKTKRVAHNKLSQEQVIEQFVEAHGNAFCYDKVVYVGVNTPVEVYCKKHEYTFYPTPKNHKNGSKCYHCGRESQIEKAKKEENKFINELTSLHRDIFDLSRLNYINSKTDVELGCEKHGFFKRKPYDLLVGRGCKECKSQESKYNNIDIFIEENKKIFGDITDFSLVGGISSDTKVDLRCTVHDHVFTINVGARLSGQKCPKCAEENYSLLRTKTTEQYINEAKEVHGSSCDYTDTVYSGATNRLTVKCNKHNIYFNTLPENHLRGGKCRKCLSENISKALKGKEGTCGYTRTGYIKQANGREARVYLIRCFNENEEFYKIGKTFLELTTRFTKSNLCYDYEEIHSIYGEAGYVYDLEVELQRKYKSYKYKPKEWFAGHTECFNMELPINKITNFNNI
jgi:hypothetical protein